MEPSKPTTDPSYFWQSAANLTTIVLVAVLLISVSVAWPDWNARVIEPATNLGTALAACFGAWAAWRGVDAWRRQLRGAANFEACKKLMGATLNVRRAIRETRESHWMGGTELRSAADTYRSRFDLPAFDEMHVTLRYRIGQWARFQKVVTIALQAEEAAAEAEILLGSRVQESMTGLRRCISSLGIELAEAIEDFDPTGRPNFTELLDTKGGPNGEFSRAVDEAVGMIHRLTDRYLQRDHLA